MSLGPRLLRPLRTVIPGQVIPVQHHPRYDCLNRNALGPACRYTYQHPEDRRCQGCWWHQDRVRDSG